MPTSYDTELNYHISPVIRPWVPFQTNLKDLDPSYKTYLDLLDSFWKRQIPLIAELLENEAAPPIVVYY